MAHRVLLVHKVQGVRKALAQFLLGVDVRLVLPEAPPLVAEVFSSPDRMPARENLVGQGESHYVPTWVVMLAVAAIGMPTRPR